MWRLTWLRDNSDHGASAVIVGILLVALVGFGALAVDAGSLWSDQKQLQNGADAGALAIAQACASDPSNPDCTGANTTADELAKANKWDKNALGTVVDPDVLAIPAQRYVQVQTQTEPPRKMLLAPVLSAAFGSGKVVTTATARWGPVGSAGTFPLALDKSEFTSTGELCFKIESKGKGPCGPGDSVHPASGSFHWLKADYDACEATSSVGDDMSALWDASTGNTPKCSTSKLTELLHGGLVLFPMYEKTLGGGSGAEYVVIGYAAVKPTAWCLDNSNPGVKYKYEDTKCSGSERWLKGEFIKTVALDGVIDDDAKDYGVNVVALTD